MRSFEDVFLGALMSRSLKDILRGGLLRTLLRNLLNKYPSVYLNEKVEGIAMNLKSKAELMVCFVSLSNILLINPLSLYPSIGSAHEAFLCNLSLCTKESFRQRDPS